MAQIASFSSGVPSTLVYLVRPSRIALMPASLTWSGVSKSGSPAPRPITSTPRRLRSSTRLVMASVGDGLMRASAADCCMGASFCGNVFRL